MGSRLGGSSLGHLACGVIGAGYTLIGIIGFGVTGFSGFFDATAYHTLLGLPINPFQSFVHLGIGLILLFGATRDAAAAEGILLGVGGVYVVAAITGLIYAHIPIFTITTSGNPDNYLHLITGLTAMAAALLSAAATGRSRRSAY